MSALTPPESASRDEKIIARWNSDETLTQRALCTRFGVSDFYVRKVLKQAGAEGRLTRPMQREPSTRWSRTGRL